MLHFLFHFLLIWSNRTQILRYELLSACSSNPCYFGSTCMDLSNGQYFCQCPVNYSGQNCDQYIPGGGGSGGSTPCSSNPCQMGSTCVNNNAQGTFTCMCPQGLTGPTCNIISLPPATQPPIILPTTSTYYQSACNSNPCLYGGTCIQNPAYLNGYQCQCLVGFIGTNCEQRQMINLCNSNSCYNGGTCQTQSQQPGQFTVVCFCPPGYVLDFDDDIILKHFFASPSDITL